MTSRRLHISDCTLRDFLHAPGVYLSTDEALQVARLLDVAGVDEIEVGIVGGATSDAALVRAVADLGLGASLSTMILCRSVDQVQMGLDEAVESGAEAVCLSIPTSQQFIKSKLDRSERAVRTLMRKCVKAAVDRGMTVAFSGEDAARAELDFLHEYIADGADAGASRFRFAESVSCLQPSTVAAKIEELQQRATIPIEVHCHSAYGLGVANTCAAVMAGATWASVTVDGLGERGGNTPLGPIMMYANTFLDEQFNAGSLTPLSRLLTEITRGGQAHFASITGVGAFQYEYLHQYQSPDVYEAFPPELVGNERSLVLGLRMDERAWNTVCTQDGHLDEQLALFREAILDEVRITRRGLGTDVARTRLQGLAAKSANMEEAR